MATQINLSRLQSQLLTSGLQQTNNALYQVINQLINAARQLQVFDSKIKTGNNFDENSGYWTLLTDGDLDETDFIFANGEPISLFIPT